MNDDRCGETDAAFVRAVLRSFGACLFTALPRKAAHRASVGRSRPAVSLRECRAERHRPPRPACRRHVARTPSNACGRARARHGPRALTRDGRESARPRRPPRNLKFVITSAAEERVMQGFRQRCPASAYLSSLARTTAERRAIHCAVSARDPRTRRPRRRMGGRER